MKKRMRETLGLTALNLFFIVLCFLTLIPILYALRVSLSGSNSLPLQRSFPAPRGIHPF